MKLNFKIVFSIVGFLLTTSLFSQELTDSQIGFDQEKMTLKLQKRGLTGENLKQEISDVRNYMKQGYLEQKKQELEKIDSIHKRQYNESTKLNRSISTVPASERAALIALYNSAGGANWYTSITTNPSNQWLINDPTSDVSLWHGVTVVNNHVEALYISRMNGFVPDLSSLSFIKTIDFVFTSFTGNFTGFQNLINLQKLIVYNQSYPTYNTPFSLIPICSLLNIQEINISRFAFDSNSLPTQMSNLINLKKLLVNSPSIQNITTIGDIPSLTHIRLYFPNFSGVLPTSFSNLQNLKFIQFQSSNVSNVDVLSSLSSIEHFDFAGNDLTSFPLNFENLINLKVIALHYNNISGSIPSYFSNFNLKSLALSSNNLEGLLPQINFSNTIYQLVLLTEGYTLGPICRQLGISGNKFRFNDLTANFQSFYNSGIIPTSNCGVNDSKFIYHNQANTDTLENLSVEGGSSITLKMSDDALNGGSYLRYTPNDTFQWYKGSYPNGVAIPFATNRQLTIPYVVATDAGNYYCLSRNPQITVHPSNQAVYDLILIRNPITLTVTAAPSPTLACPETFEGATFPPPGWAVFDNGVNNAITPLNWETNPSACSGAKAAYMNRQNIGIGNTSEEYLTTPLMTVPANGVLKFCAKSMTLGDLGTIYQVKVKLQSAGAQNVLQGYGTISSWTELTMPTVFTDFSVDLSVYAGLNVYIAFVMKNTQTGTVTTGDRWFVDNVSVIGCETPNPTISVSNIATTTATINWTNSTTNSLAIEYGPQGFTAGTGTLLPPTATSPYTITGLAAGATYTLNYRYTCTACDSTTSTPWVGGPSFTTNSLPVCNAPTLNAVSNITATSATLSWTQIGAVASYQLVVQPIYSGVPTTTPISLPATTSTYTITGLTPGVQYEYYLRAVCSPTLSSTWVSAPINIPTQLSCTATKPLSNYVKLMFKYFLNELLQHYNTWGSVDQFYASGQFDALKPYITDENPRIYNFQYINQEIRFSFSNHANLDFPDVVINYVPETSGAISNFDFSNYQGSEIYLENNTLLGNNLQYTNGTVSKNFKVKHVNFCPDTCVAVGAQIQQVAADGCIGNIRYFSVIRTGLEVIPNNVQFSWVMTKDNATNVVATSTSTTFFSYTPVSAGTYTVTLTITGPGCQTVLTDTFFIPVLCPGCANQNPNATNIKTALINLLNKIVIDHNAGAGLAINNSYAGSSIFFQQLAPYITDQNPGIYNFSYTNNLMQFSFSNHPGDPDIRIGSIVGGGFPTIVDMSLTSFVSDENYFQGAFITFNDIYKTFGVKHIKFCAPLSNPCTTVINGDIRITSRPICTNTPIDFELFSDATVPLTYNWTFTHINTGSVYTVGGANPAVTFPHLGEYLVELTVTDSAGCTTKFEYSFKIETECTPCYKTNAYTSVVQNLFMDLVNHLNQFTTLPNGYSCSQLDVLSNYITDADPAIYNFSNTGDVMTFSFAQHNAADVSIPISAGTTLVNFDLGNYAAPYFAANLITYLSNGRKSNKGYVTHINFCPTTGCLPIDGSIKIETDSFCTATDMIFSFGTGYDTSLLEYQWTFNFFDPNLQQFVEIYSTDPNLFVENPTLQFPFEGTYQVVLSILDENDCVTIIRDKFEITSICKKCFEVNPGIEDYSKQAFISLLNHLVTIAPSTVLNGYTCDELSNLSSYITDPLPRIYNFVNTGTEIKFSFSDHGPNNYDVVVLITNINLISEINLYDYVFPGIRANIKVTYADGTSELGAVRHINFCTECKNIDGSIIIKQDSQNVCQGILTDFTFETPNSIINYIWSFYDSNYNLLQSVNTDVATMLFQNIGVYYVGLQVIDKDNCKQTFYSTFTVETCPNTPVVTDCKVHFNFNFKIPSATFGGVLDNDGRTNIANGITNFVNSRFGEQLFVTTYDDKKTGLFGQKRPRRTVTDQNAIAYYPPAENISGTITNSLLQIQHRNLDRTFNRTINSTIGVQGIVPQPTVNDIDVSFFIVSDDRYTTTAELQTAYNDLVSSNKTDKIFFILVSEGKFKNTTTNTSINPLEFVTNVMGTTPAVDYATTGTITTSDYMIYTKSDITDPSFVDKFKDFLDNAYKEIKPESCDISCTVNNPHTSVIRYMFADLLKNLASPYIVTVADNSTTPELDLLRPYITDANAKIWNFIKTPTSMSFSFANHSIAEPDVVINFGTEDIGLGATGDFGGIDLSNYMSSDTETLFKYNGNQTENNKVKHINFCPDELYCKHHVAIVVDESGSINEEESIKIRRQLKSFVEKQLTDNNDLGSNMHISLIGLSNSDTDNRTDHKIADLKISSSNIGSYREWIEKYKNRYNNPAYPNVSPSSDFWNSGLTTALNLNFTPDIVVLITDGCQTNDLTGATLKTTMDRFNNNNEDPTKKTRLFVIGIENGYYVDEDLAGRPALTRQTDPNLEEEVEAEIAAQNENEEIANEDDETIEKVIGRRETNENSSTSENNFQIENRVTPFLKKSLKFLLDYQDPVAYPKEVAKSNYLLGPDFQDYDYMGMNDFLLFGSTGDVNFISNGIIVKDVGPIPPSFASSVVSCGKQILLKQCDECTGFQPIAKKDYILSAWVKEEQTVQVATYEDVSIKLVFETAGREEIATMECTTKGEIIDGWQRIFKKFIIPEGTVYLNFELLNNSPGNPVYFDDIRIHPADGSMKSFVYDPETFKLMSEMDENNYSTFYEYDNEGGLIRVKKETERGIKTIQETRSGSVIKN